MVDQADNKRVPRPEETRHRLGGRVVAAGPMARRNLGNLLGFYEDRESDVTAAAWVDHAVDVAVVHENQTHVFHLERRTPEARGLVLTEHVNLYSRGKDLPLTLAEIVQNVASEALATWTMEHLGVLIESDPQSGKPGMPAPPLPDESTRPRSLLDTWGAEDSYADFFAGGEIARSQLDSIDPSTLFHFVQHCDAECLFVNPHSIGSVVSLVNYPWDDRVREPSRPFDQNMANYNDKEQLEEGMVTTDLVEDDVILGNPQKFESLMKYAVSRPDSEEKVLFVSNTCVPTVIGEDVESVVKRYRKTSGKEILYLTVTPRSMTNVFHGMLVDRRLRAEENTPPAEPDTVNLIGFARGKSAKELTALLDGVGIEVNIQLLPDLTPERVDALAQARLHVLYPNRLWQNMYDQLLVRSRVPAIDPAAPYGLVRTRQWLDHVLRALRGNDTPEVSDERWAEVVQPWQGRWEALQQQARKLRLGFVVRDKEAYFLTNPAASWGVPLLAFAEEMGFGIDILMRVSEPKVAKEAALTIRKAFSEPERHSIRAFDSFPFLRQRLKDCPAQAFLSYHFYDWRLSEAGKASFSIQHLETGIPGAVRSLERLIRVCNTTLYRRYHRYLTRTEHGLRSTEKKEVSRA